MTPGNRRESTFHSIIEEQFSIATLNMIVLYWSPRISSERDSFPHFVQHEKANPAQARRFTNFQSRAGQVFAADKESPFAVRDFIPAYPKRMAPNGHSCSPYRLSARVLKSPCSLETKTSH